MKKFLFLILPMVSYAKVPECFNTTLQDSKSPLTQKLLENVLAVNKEDISRLSPGLFLNKSLNTAEAVKKQLEENLIEKGALTDTAHSAVKDISKIDKKAPFFALGSSNLFD
ncbi:MAG: hypothetical protein BGO07_03990 [Alphaproteobacteria bacterium 40-19]|nr:MAG: hypothetical protein BGO07_03990 [Alphaproteobacteria bacterium 40-19]